MNRSILEAIHLAFSHHGLSAQIREGAVYVQDGLRLEPRVTPSPNSTPERVLLQLDVITQSPRLKQQTLVDSFAGVGPTQQAAESNAFIKFLTGSFHVVAEALTSHQCNESQVEWLDWRNAAEQWRVCSGPSLINSSGKAPYHANGLYQTFFEELKALFQKSANPGPHWARVFFGSMQGRLSACEVVLDGRPWTEAQARFSMLFTEFPEHYETLRHLFIAVPQL